MLAETIVAHNKQEFTVANQLYNRFNRYSGNGVGLRSNTSLEEMIATEVEILDVGSLDFGRYQLDGNIGFCVNTGDTCADALCYLEISRVQVGDLYDIRQQYPMGVLFIGNCADLRTFGRLIAESAMY